jgi:hypothetical protein
VIYGDADVITPPARNQDVAAVWPSAAVHVIPGVGHALYLEQPDTFNALLARVSLADAPGMNLLLGARVSRPARSHERVRRPALPARP